MSFYQFCTRKKAPNSEEVDIIINARNVQIRKPFGLELKGKSEWYGHEHFGDWPHKGSALSVGESSLLRYGVTYPLRTGLENPDNEEFPEMVTYKHVPTSGHFEEVVLDKGMCIVSQGPIGGPSKLKGIYRPLDSYGTGAKVKAVVKTEFPQDIKEGCFDKDTYICMVENGGISLYAEGKSESHTAYMAEFQIDRVLPCSMGLLVVPVRQSPNEISDSHDSRFLYVLTHPTKQVSRIWEKSANTDFSEHDASSESVVWTQDDLCISWNSGENDGFSIKRIVKLKKEDIAHSTTLNASIYYTNHQETSNSPFAPAGGSSSYSTIGRLSSRISSSLKGHREGHSMNYWPSFGFDFSNISTHGLAIGFYPPHYCVYDDPEYYFFTLCRVKEAFIFPEQPRKFQIIHNKSSNCLIIWCLVENTLHRYSVHLDAGKVIPHSPIPEIRDVIVDTEQHFGLYMLAVLMNDDDSNIIKLGILNIESDTIEFARIDDALENRVCSLDHILCGDTLICSLKDSRDKAVITLKNIKNSEFSPVLLSTLNDGVPSEMLKDCLSLYLRTFQEDSQHLNWSSFAKLVNDFVCQDDKTKGSSKIISFERALRGLKQEMKISGYPEFYCERLSVLLESLKAKHLEEFKVPIFDGKVSIFDLFLSLLTIDSPTKSPKYSSLPKVLQILIDNPDCDSSIFSLCNLKLEGRSFSPVIDIIVSDVLQRNQLKVKFDWPKSVISMLGREDHLIPTIPTKSPTIRCNPFSDREDFTNEDFDWTSYVANLQIFTEDRRLEEVCKLLDSASALTIDIEQKAEVSDHDFLEDQEKHLLQLMQVTLSAPVGRGAFTLCTEVKSFADLTNAVNIPKLCLAGKCARRGTNIELNDSDLSTSAWPTFHNAVAATLAVRFSDQPADAWFAYNKAKTTEGPEQAGMILGFGLNGILTSMPPTLQHEYLSKENSYMSMAMLMGLSVNKVGSGDMATWKVISLHINAMLPACTTELEIPKLASLAAPIALGLLFLGTHQSHIGKVLLGEISKRYSPLSLFGGGNQNNSAAPTTTADPNISIADREAHSLCAGFGLGFVNLGKGKLKNGNLNEDGFDGILRRFVVGGPKPQSTDRDDELNQVGLQLPSLWEEYRCCHIEEGDNVNVDVATPSAIVATALTYLRSGNEAVLKWLSPPTTLQLLDGVRPDILMLRAVAYILVLEDIKDVGKNWMARTLAPHMELIANRVVNNKSERSLFEKCCTDQVLGSIICGYCLGLGIRYAGTNETRVVEILWKYIDAIVNTGFEDCGDLPKNFLEFTVCSMVLSLSLVLAGTGDVDTLRLCRYMQHRISAIPVTATNNSYGLEMCISMAIGLLFLGGGRYSLRNDDKSIAVIFASVFPKWPINGSDNRYHLQALRHLYVLACEPRLLLPQPVPHGQKLFFELDYVDGKIMKVKAPVLLPPFEYLKKITLVASDTLPVQFLLPKDLVYLKSIVEGNGIIHVIQKPVNSIKNKFLKQMAWRESRTFHSTFPDDSSQILPANENREVRELDLLSRLAEASGLSHIIPPLVTFKNGNPTDPEWQQQLRILNSWIIHKNHQVPTSLPAEIVGILLNKADPDFDLFVSPQDAENILERP